MDWIASQSASRLATSRSPKLLPSSVATNYEPRLYRLQPDRVQAEQGPRASSGTFVGVPGSVQDRLHTASAVDLSRAFQTFARFLVRNKPTNQPTKPKDQSPA